MRVSPGSPKTAPAAPWMSPASCSRGERIRTRGFSGGEPAAVHGAHRRLWRRRGRREPAAAPSARRARASASRRRRRSERRADALQPTLPRERRSSSDAVRARPGRRPRRSLVPALRRSACESRASSQRGALVRGAPQLPRSRAAARRARSGARRARVAERTHGLRGGGAVRQHRDCAVASPQRRARARPGSAGHVRRGMRRGPYCGSPCGAREGSRSARKLGEAGRIRLVHRAVEAKRTEGVRLMAELGFELDRWTEHDRAGINLHTTPLHNAAWMGNLEMAKLLIELGRGFERPRPRLRGHSPRLGGVQPTSGGCGLSSRKNAGIDRRRTRLGRLMNP